MEPTPYTFTPQQWGMLQNLVDETGMDMRGVITAALGSYQNITHQHDYPGTTHAPVGVRPPHIDAEKRLQSLQSIRGMWKGKAHDILKHIEEGREDRALPTRHD